jgi:1,4-alpha-glucan branching enzyme
MHLFEQLERAQCKEPFSYLGPQRIDNTAGVRAWFPGADAVTLIFDAKGKNEKIALNKITESGGFQVSHRLFEDAEHYSFEVTYAGQVHTVVDPYQFQAEAFHSVHYIDHQPQNLYQQGGAHTISLLYGQLSATRFAVYAPNAGSVSIIGDFNQWDGRCHPMQKTELGFWVLVLPQVIVGMRYKFEIKNQYGELLPHKSDPLGFAAEPFPSHASLVYDHTTYQWRDEAWMLKRQTVNVYESPMSIYEVHLGSWHKPTNSEQRYLNYREIAPKLVEYVKEMHYTHIELMPVSEFPFDGSWGYQPIGMFAPTSRFGSPDDFKYFIDYCHQHDVGVIIDWVPAHFPEDGHGLARFDGSCVYEYEDSRKGWHPDWNSCIYDFGKDTVRQFLVASALMWLDYFHVDGLRVDAVASMLYLDYSRKTGEWVPNVDGGNRNYEAISLLQWMNKEVYSQHPGAITIAEESTSFPQVSKPVYEGGLGFGFKWNMGWMNDSLEYIQKDPSHRKYHHSNITFSMVYAFDENFILPLSHDEVVHGKNSLLNKMPGDEWQQAANLRAYVTFMFAHPGKKLNFMGNEIAQGKEWDHDSGLDWELLKYPKHQGIQTLYKTLNVLYQSFSALHESDHHHDGFNWVDYGNNEQSVLSFVRYNKDRSQSIYVIVNFTPVPRTNFVLNVQEKGVFKCIFSSDDSMYWGSDFPFSRRVSAETQNVLEQSQAISLDLPPLCAQYWLAENKPS